ncbi:uncharacterized protein LOC136087055 [Hydra vulgaris]|uniref:Uncharacterized protein LOC136087055 n=1 Tax=Hydra vulgaris TaxID=6087 RepID=A0ABM4CUP2_HYDVU
MHDLEVDTVKYRIETKRYQTVGLVHYLPHRPVIREDKVTTKLRIVFDASATSSGPSLNDCLHSGPSLTTLLNRVLIRFRVNNIAFIADIEKAFLNISISEKHRNFIRFLWYENINNLDIKNLKNHKLVTYRLCRVLFGVTSSPFLLSATLIKHAERYLSSDPIFVSRLLNSIHVDDLSFCSDSVIECFNFYKKCRSRLGEAGFNLRKFESNSVELDKLINETNFQSQNITKVLGLTWNKKLDLFIFSFFELFKIAVPFPTKRDVLSFTASFFDPLGLINTVTVRLKILFQQICISKIGWDCKINKDLLKVWQDIYKDLSSVQSICVPRCYFFSKSSASCTRFELYGFSDASLKAFGCYSYICLHWIKNSNKIYETFIQNRLEKIRDLFDFSFWDYVETYRNPADIISRGASIENLTNNQLWFNGPKFLYTPEIWPSFDQNKLIYPPEETKILLITNESFIDLKFIDITNFNSYCRLIRVTAYILKFVSCLKNTQVRNSNPLLSFFELRNAKIIWIKFIQQNIYSSKNYKQLKNDLGFFFDSEGIIRCRGRLGNAPISYNIKFPIFLPKESLFTELIILHCHESVKHNGVKETLSQLRLYEGKTYSYPNVPPSPLSRVNDDYVFKYTGIDYCGPLFVKNIYSEGEIFKCWIFLASCASTRFIHLDLVPDCSALACIRGLRRLISKFGAPYEIISDNGSCFTADETQQFTSSRGILWHFNVAAAPWWGGFFERMVRSVKRVLRKILKTARLSYEEVLTILAEIEVVTNNRQLTFSYEEPGDEPLSPNHLVFGKRISSETLLIKNSDVVTIQDSNLVRGLWKIGIVEKLLPPTDGQVRAANVRCISAGKIMYLTCPVNKLCLLEENKVSSVETTFVNESNIQLFVTTVGGGSVALIKS